MATVHWIENSFDLTKKDGKMKKIIIIAIFCFILPFSAIAAEINGLVGAAIGYLSSTDAVAIAFNAKAGKSLTLAGISMQYSSTTGYCGLARYGASGLIISGYSTSMFTVTVPADDFYMFLCLKSSGTSGDFAAIVLDNSYFTTNSTQAMQSQLISDAEPDLTIAVEKAIDQKFGR